MEACRLLKEYAHSEGLEEGSDNLAKLLKSLTDAGKPEDVNRVISDSDYRQKLLHEYDQEENSTL